MLLPSFKTRFHKAPTKPRMLVLKVRSRLEPMGAPVAWVIIEREETFKHAPDGQLMEATISFSYEQIKEYHRDLAGYKNEFHASYTAYTNTVSLTARSNSTGLVALDLSGLKGNRIGTYFFTEIVNWVKQWPEASVNQVHLLRGQSHKENRERRNRFYERYGLEFDYEDHDHCAGISKPMLAADLKPVMTWEQNITEVGVMEYMAELLRTNEMVAADLSARDKAVKWLSEDIRQMQAKPFRWAAMFWLRNHTLKALAVIMLVALATFTLVKAHLGETIVESNKSEIYRPAS